MGNKQKKRKIQKKKQKEKNERINKSLQEGNNFEKEMKLLVLGTGDSGKSTFVKQAQILFKDGFDEKQREVFKQAIRNNLILHMKLLINGVYDFGLDLSKSNEKLAKRFLEISDRTQPDQQIAETISKLWEDSSVKEVFDRRSELQIPDTANYYLDAIDRIVEKNYRPTDKDIVFCRIPTTGINELKFSVQEHPWRIVDVGGQKSERRKWIHQFDDVSMIIYVVAMSEYDQNLYEDENINRMYESLELFDSIASNRIFTRTSIILVFNKMDIFEEKIKKTDPKICFKNYSGGCDFEKAKKYITKQFIKVVKTKRRKVFPFYTQAANSKSIKKTFETIIETVLENSNI
ncbi:guanine nucleotide-binding protein g(o) subunit alpha [Anaeramoeba flamelloides]|uniref:Guanine nucleotide-binding protein g(O) subunit alpha n=1 Tax=Anaeramoeba flamelloides TaxID=1746091 RepID=A0AAV7Y9U6_9EUKA|nr:guanine nucleotide-binding protein g(o) subunit alpha [Anaeramoeba flamelloides]